MKRHIFLALLVTAGAALAQPVVTGAANAAGYMRSGLPNGGLAQGSYIAIFGTGLGPATLAQQSAYPLTTGAFNGVGAQITVGATTVDLIITYTTAVQVGAIVPSTTPVGSGQLRLSYNNQTSAAFAVTIVERAFGIFAINQAGTGPAATFKYTPAGVASTSTVLEAATAGQTMAIFGTGLGRVPYADNIGATFGDLPGDVELWVGGLRATITYRGRIPGISAIDQINFVVPAGVTPGCYVSLLVRTGTVVSNAATISVSTGSRACSDPSGFSESALERVRGGADLNVGSVSLSKFEAQLAVQGFSITSKIDSMSAAFQRFSATQLIGAEAFGATSIGSCTVYQFSGQETSRVAVIRPTGLDAGNALTVTNSNGSKTMARVANLVGIYSASVNSSTPIPGVPSIPGAPGSEPEYLTTGNHTVTGPGGPGVGPFSVSTVWPAAFVWSNRDAITAVVRSQDLTVRWTGGDPQGNVAITGFSITGTGPAAAGAGFFCLANTAAGQFTVPSVILLALPSSAPSTEAAFGNLAVSGAGRAVQFSATGLDFGVLSYQSGFTKTLAYQ